MNKQKVKRNRDKYVRHMNREKHWTYHRNKIPHTENMDQQKKKTYSCA